jgi:predicted dehydrogenase
MSVSGRTHAVGIVGVGNISGAHLEAFATIPEWDVVAVCDVVPERAQAAADTFGIPLVYDNIDKMLANDDIEIVDVATQPEPRVRLASAVIDAGKHLLCEKPLCRDAADAEALAAAANAAGIVHAVCHEYRYFPLHRTMRQLVQDGFVGDLRVVALERTMNSGFWFPPDHWMRDRAVGGGFLLQALVHSLDLVRYVCDDFELDVLQSSGDQTGAPAGTDMQDSVAMTGRIAGDALFDAWGGWRVAQPEGVRWSIHGSTGSLRLESHSHRTAEPDATLLGGAHDGEGELLEPAAGTELPDVPEEIGLMGAMFVALANDVLSAIDGTEGPHCFSTFDDAARLMRAVEVG